MTERRVRTLVLVAVLVMAGIVALRSSFIHRIYLPTATGITAKQVCSLHFVSGFTPERARSLYIDPLLRGFGFLVPARVGPASVESSLFGLFYRQRAVYREGLGCTLVHGRRDFDAGLQLPLPHAFTPMTLDASHRDAHFDTAALRTALDAAFQEPDGDSGQRNTLAVVVLHQGRLIAERYADGVSAATPLHGWSMAKSVTATLAGAMVERGEITLRAPVITRPDVLAREPHKSEITLQHALGMTTGLHLDESRPGMDQNSRMLFTRSDMAGWAARQKQEQAPGEVWKYMSGNTILAMRAMQDRLPGARTVSSHAQAVRERVFEPLGMHSAVFEVDEAGTLQGSSYVYAAAQDWARLGQAYLSGATVRTDIVSTPSRGGSRMNQRYGLGFWLGHNGIDGRALSMNGFQGQSVYILPDHELVIVRLGASHAIDSGAYELAAAVAAALKTFVPSVQIGSQTWSAHNLAVTAYRNGDPIPHAATAEAWWDYGVRGIGAWTYPLGDSTLGASHGLLYNWHAVNDGRGLAPARWRIPASDDWDVLAETLGADSAGTQLKTTNGWSSGGEGTNSRGFSALASGFRWHTGEYTGDGIYASWWTSTAYATDDYFAWYRGVGADYPYVHSDSSSTYFGFSVRLIAE